MHPGGRLAALAIDFPEEVARRRGHQRREEDRVGARQKEGVEYPNILALAGLNDPRVQYWEPAKCVAKLRDYNKSDSTILLNTNMETGHSGASGRFEALKEIAMEYAFLIGLEKDLF